MSDETKQFLIGAIAVVLLFAMIMGGITFAWVNDSQEAESKWNACVARSTPVECQNALEELEEND